LSDRDKYRRGTIVPQASYAAILLAAKAELFPSRLREGLGEGMSITSSEADREANTASPSLSR